MIESVAGFIIAAPTPCTLRAAINDAAPPASPHQSEAPVNTTRPAMKIARRARRSASLPPLSRSTPKVSAYALMTHSISDAPMWRSFWIDGSATFTTVLSSMIMNRPTATAASVHHFLFSGVKSLALTLQRLENSYASPRGGVRLDADAGAGRERERHAARAAARGRALSRPPPHLDRGA